MSPRKPVAELVAGVKAFKPFSKTALLWLAQVPIYRKILGNAVLVKTILYGDGLTEVYPIRAISGEWD